MGIVVIGAVFVDVKGYPESNFIPTASHFFTNLLNSILFLSSGEIYTVFNNSDITL